MTPPTPTRAASPEPRDPLPFLHFSTLGLSTRDAYAAWRESISVIFAAERDGRDEATFHADLSAHHLGDLLFSRTALSAQRFVRTPAMIRRDGLDHFLIQVYRSGGYTGMAGERAIRLAAGQVSVLDLAKPMTTDACESETLSLLVPRPLLDALLPTDALHGAAFGGELAGVFIDYAQALHRRLPALSRADAPFVVRPLLELFAGMAAARLPLTPSRSEQQEFALARAKRHIERQLASPTLSPAAIGAAAGISRGTLYRLFEPLGGVAHYVLARRLARCREALLDPAERRRIADIAYAHGFVSEAHFSRAFRRRYGQSPSEARTEGRHAAIAADRADDAGIDGWIRGFQRLPPAQRARRR